MNWSRHLYQILVNSYNVNRPQSNENYGKIIPGIGKKPSGVGQMKGCAEINITIIN
jgi:hypothetical protein